MVPDYIYVESLRARGKARSGNSTCSRGPIHVWEYQQMLWIVYNVEHLIYSQLLLCLSLILISHSRHAHLQCLYCAALRLYSLRRLQLVVSITSAANTPQVLSTVPAITYTMRSSILAFIILWIKGCTRESEWRVVTPLRCW